MSNSKIEAINKLKQAAETLNLAIEQLSAVSDDIPSDALFDVIISLETNADYLSEIEQSVSELVS